MTQRITIKVRRSGGRDRYGDPKGPTVHEIRGCSSWPRESSETQDRSDTVVVGRSISVPHGSDLVSTDEVLLPGEDEDGPWWQIDGGVEFWGPHPVTGRTPGAVVALTKATG